MRQSVYLARLLGPALTIVGASILLYSAQFASIAEDILRSPALLFFASATGAIAGTAVVLAHNVWVADWRLIITLLGWITLLDSASWLLMQPVVEAFWSPLLDLPAVPLVGGGIALASGLMLSYVGFVRGSRPH
jgi:hypothetical protein